jgi:hypothetical protein
MFVTDLLAQAIGCLVPVVRCVSNDTMQVGTAARALGCIPGGFWGTPTLPQHDSDQFARKRQILGARRTVLWDTTSVPGISLAKGVPVEQYPSLPWLVVASGQALKIVANFLDLLASGQLTASEEQCTRCTQTLGASTTALENALSKISTRAGKTADKQVVLDELSDDGVFQDQPGASLGDWVVPCGCGGPLTNPCSAVVDPVVAPCKRCTSAVIGNISAALTNVVYDFIGTVLDNPGFFKKDGVTIEDYNQQFRGTGTNNLMHLPWMGQKRERLHLLEIFHQVYKEAMLEVGQMDEAKLATVRTYDEAMGQLQAIAEPVAERVMEEFEKASAQPIDVGSLRSSLKGGELSQTPREQLKGFLAKAVIEAIRVSLFNEVLKDPTYTDNPNQRAQLEEIAATASNGKPPETGAVDQKAIDILETRWEDIFSPAEFLKMTRRSAGSRTALAAEREAAPFAVGYSPDRLYNFESNRVFAWQRTAGQNPMLLTRVRDLAELQKKIAITDALYKKAIKQIDGSEDRYWGYSPKELRLLNEILESEDMLREEFFNPPFGNDTLQRAFEEKRLFTVDFPQLDGATGTLGPFGESRYLYQPIGLFALPPKPRLEPGERDPRQLSAIALQSAVGVDDPSVPIVLPTDRYTWRTLCSLFQQADSMESEYPEHLGQAHMMTETFHVATRRTLSTQHPLYRLLVPHYDNTITTNHIAVTAMLESRGLTQSLQSLSTIEATRISARAVHLTNVGKETVWNRLVAQGTEDPEVLPNYPYREDAMRIWKAIETWVRDYVDIFYATDQDTCEDWELQDWVHELQSPTGGNLHGIGEGGVIRTKAQLVDVLTVTIFHASAKHALTNFPLSQVQIYAPCEPMSIFRPAPTTNDQIECREAWLEYLPPLRISILQQTLGFIVGTTHYTRLGLYPTGNFGDTPKVAERLRAFNSRLREIESEIASDNENRPLPYIYLLPSRIPQSVNI